MDDQTRTALVEELYSGEANDLENEQPLLAHYTSLATVEKIISHQEIWFSHPLLMNDHEEVNFAIQAGSDAIVQSDAIKAVLTEGRRFQILLGGFNEARRRYYEQHLFDTYVFCLSQHEPDDVDGRLSMWRGYGGNGTGAAIVFDSKKLGTLANSPLIIARVIYKTPAERIRWFSDYEGRIAQFLYRNVMQDADLTEIGGVVFERLKTAAIFSKHCGFQEEQEWRVVYMPERDPTGLLKPYLHYQNGPRGIEPRLRFKIAPLNGVTAGELSLERLVDRIILGPSRSPLARGAAERMLRMSGKPALAQRLHASGIPYRSLP